MFIGFYDYTVVLTYMSLLSSIVGMTEALDGRFEMPSPVLWYPVSVICWMERWPEPRKTGLKIRRILVSRSIRSVSFLLRCFSGVFNLRPGCERHCGNDLYVRLCAGSSDPSGYFNVKEMRRQQETEERRKSYEGLPVTSISIIFPLIYLLRPYCGHTAYLRILIAVMFIVAFLFVSKIRVLKPGNKLMAFFIVAGLVILGKLLHIY